MSSHPEQNLSTLLIAFTGKIATSSNLWKEANGFNPMRPGLNWRDEEENEEKGNDGKISVIDPRT